ncbi:MarR family winged helix-turn-helix transcriptional regulator [Prevotella sp. 10(H)]|uniref:MarR family winged helix-turn-helix transcriptional regulator n=1 Tax=Prevotella sp. 10(H) TaxID=1158294 RepID=UPI00068E7BD1|nr:MarR family transcriptional regulator [Prevotella sp. 10(H)]
MNKEEELQDPLLNLDILLWRTIKVLTKHRRHILERFGITCSQFEILCALHYFSSIRAEIIQIDLAEKTDIDPMTTSTILRTLQKKKYITRNRSAVNTRTVIVEITQDGIDLVEKASVQIKNSNKEIYQDINKKLVSSQLLKLLNRINKLNY